MVSGYVSIIFFTFVSSSSYIVHKCPWEEGLHVASCVALQEKIKIKTYSQEFADAHHLSLVCAVDVRHDEHFDRTRTYLKQTF